MSEIEKMYENAGVKKLTLDCYYNQPFCCKKCNHYKDNENCEYQVVKETYPPFTAKKQIAILQLLTQQCDLTISHFGEWEFIHYDGQEPLEITGTGFVETFAKLINAYWQDLTESEQEQIRSILNG